MYVYNLLQINIMPIDTSVKRFSFKQRAHTMLIEEGVLITVCIVVHAQKYRLRKATA